jgi:cyclase
MLTRRTFLTTSTAALAATVVPKAAFAQPTFAEATAGRQPQPPAPVTPLFKELRRNTGYWTARGGTIGWLINPDGVVAIDSQFPDTAALCLDELLKKSGQADIATLINRHHHGDHTGGNAVFRPKTKQIVAHANVPKYLKAGYDAQVAKRAQMNPPPTTPAPAEPAAIDRTMTDSLTLTHGDERISIKHYGPAYRRRCGYLFGAGERRAHG